MNFSGELVLVGVAVCEFWIYILLLRGCIVLALFGGERVGVVLG